MPGCLDAWIEECAIEEDVGRIGPRSRRQGTIELMASPPKAARSRRPRLVLARGCLSGLK